MSAPDPLERSARFPALGDLADDVLLARLRLLVKRGNEHTAQLLAYLGEVDARRLYLPQGCSSMYIYMTEVLHFSESGACHRICAARAARRFPIILEMVAEGALHLSGIEVLAAHLTPENHRVVLAEARHKSKLAIQKIVAGLSPKPDVSESIRKLPQPARAEPAPLAPSSEQPNPSPATASSSPALAAQPVAEVPPAGPPAPRAVLAPLSPQRYKVQFTASEELYNKIAQARQLLFHQIPSGDLAAIFDKALTVLLDDLKRKKLGATTKPRPPKPGATSNSRRIPNHVKRAVWARDGGQCTFFGPDGKRCSERRGLEFDHVVPYARDPRQATVDGTRLLCAAHNQHKARLDFGPLLAREPMAPYGQRPLGEALACGSRGVPARPRGSQPTRSSFGGRGFARQPLAGTRVLGPGQVRAATFAGEYSAPHLGARLHGAGPPSCSALCYQLLESAPGSQHSPRRATR